MTSVAVERNVLEIAVTVIHCTDARHFVAPTDLVALVPCVGCVTGAYQTSATYVNPGIKTAQ